MCSIRALFNPELVNRISSSILSFIVLQEEIGDWLEAGIVFGFVAVQRVDGKKGFQFIPSFFDFAGSTEVGGQLVADIGRVVLLLRSGQGFYGQVEETDLDQSVGEEQPVLLVFGVLRADFCGHFGCLKVLIEPEAGSDAQPPVAAIMAGIERHCIQLPPSILHHIQVEETSNTLEVQRQPAGQGVSVHARGYVSLPHQSDQFLRCSG